jgi:hypothetical protein
MKRAATALACVSLIYASLGGRAGAALAPPDLSGSWKLNPDASDMPREAGFDPNYVDTGSNDSRGGGGGRGGRGGGGGTRIIGNIAPSFESEEDSKKLREISTEVTHPSATLTITQTPAAVTIADPDHGTRVFPVDGKEHTIQLQSGPIGAVTKWDPTQLLIRYLIEKNRELRITLARAADGHQLIITTQFAEKGRGQLIKRVYD